VVRGRAAWARPPLLLLDVLRMGPAAWRCPGPALIAHRALIEA
jgi:hypothetical protein